MNTELACTLPLTAAKDCLHCGAPIPVEAENRGQTAGSTSFCCNGCATVYQILQERGLQTYYVLRDRAGQPRNIQPSTSAAEEFDYLDDPDFLKEYAFGDGRQMRFYLEGVHCAACVWLTEKLPEFVEEVESLHLNLATGVARVQIKPQGRFADAARELQRLGYRPHPVRQGESEALQKKENRQHLIRLGVAGMAAGNIMLLAVSLYAGADGQMAKVFRWVSFLLFQAILFYSAVPFYQGAWGALRKRQISIDVSIVLGLLVATSASIVNLIQGSEHIYFDSIATLIFLLLSTRYLLKRINQHALNTSQLMHFLAPSKARRLATDLTGYEEVKSDSLHEGDIIEVRAGETFPADGIVTRGESNVNCALLTGESQATRVVPGVRVNAGTWNQDSPLQVRVLTAGPSTRLGKILTAMETSLISKPPIVSHLDRVGQAFVAAVLVLTVIGFLIGLPHGWHEAVNRALAVAIIVCPCTFALATPLAMSLAISRAAKIGVLVKSAEFIERMSKVQSVFFDKTGTLTYGELRVVKWWEILPGATQALVALESRSAHPIARAVIRHFDPNQTSTQTVEGFREKAGFGASGTIQWSFYQATRDERPHELEIREAQAVGDSSVTQVILLKDGLLAGVLTLADRLRDDSRQAIEKLKNLDVSLHLISGDRIETVETVASRLGFSPQNITARATPEQKSEILRSAPLSLMVGDGANDAVALASAFASIAVQGGMEVSIRAAGAYCTRPGVSSTPALIEIARETMKVIYRNLAFAIIYNLIGIATALSGHLNPLFAAVLMPVSALTVFLSTLAGTQRLREIN